MPDPLTPDQQALAAAHTWVVRFVLRRHFRAAESNPYLRDVVRTAAVRGLVDAARRYDPARNVKFCTFASTTVWGVASKARDRFLATPDARASRQPRDPELDRLALVADRRAVDPVAAADRRDAAAAVLARVDEIDRPLLVLFFGLGGERPLLVREIAERVGALPDTVAHRLRRAVERARARLGVTWDVRFKFTAERRRGASA